MMYLGIAVLCLTIVSGAISNDNIVNYMTPEEIRQVFHTDSVPQYEVVKVNLSKRLHKRDLPAGSKLHIRAFGEDINLWLHPRDTVLAERNTPVYYARSNENKTQGVEYTKMDGLMDTVGNLLEDPNLMAAFIIGTDGSGNPTVNGHIGSKKIVVRSLPTRVTNEYRRRRRSVDDSDDLDQNYHIVFGTTDSYEKRFPGMPVNMTAVRQRIARSTSGVIPDILYPEVLVVIEYSLYRDYENNINGLLEYILAFWNGVDLKYRSLESPKFRFHISAIVLSTEPSATPYISKYQVGFNSFDTWQALPAARIFYYGVKDTFPLDSYDTPVTITKQRLGVGHFARIYGQAYTGRMCVHNDTTKVQDSVSIFRDDGAFSGIFIAAHELGHSIGSPAMHDPLTHDCQFRNGFIMAPVPMSTKNSSDFSSCSTEVIDAFIKNGTLDCLFNRPQVSSIMLPKLMPGRIKNLEQQCRALKKGAPCVKPDEPNQDICINFYCLNSEGVCTPTKTGAIDGTSCGSNNKFCLHMKCVSL